MTRRSSKRTGWSERLASEKTLGRGRRSQRRKPQPRQTPRKEEPPRWQRGWATLLVGALLAGALLYLMFGTSWFYVYEVELVGERLLSEEEAHNRSQLEGWSLFWLNPSSVAVRLEQDPLILEALVSPKPPNAVRIEVQERLPVAVWQTQGQSYFVDGAGVVFALRGDARRHIVVRDLSDTSVEIGDAVDVNALQAARELSRWMPERRAWDWEPGQGVSFLSDEGWRVVIGDQSQLATKIKAYRAFQSQHDSTQEIVYLDVSVPEHAYYRTNGWLTE